ncbi:hypothetical protein B0J18DRAFT_453334 [Chaetomium sp. MPI-SDFR-AT-0129]|nr:hypothetical protein B0J18DRAFT_453334 [Chaetomium sp. MPI-SDFR-AT-0129]
MTQPSNSTLPTTEAMDPTTDFFAEYNLGQALVPADDGMFQTVCSNLRDPYTNLPEAHRIYLTGYDRAADITAVRGRLVHVTHGTLVPTSNSPTNPSRPATLIVFEWLLIPGRLGRRFKEVNIDVTFSAEGKRQGAYTPRDIERFTPSVEKVAPSVPLKTRVTARGVTQEVSIKGKLMVGYPPIVQAGPEVSKRTRVDMTKLDFTFAAGYPTFVKKSGGEPNSVHWTLRENASEESGLPSLVRTAVLVKRRERDNLGQFKADITANVKASRVGDRVESFRKLVGLAPKDDPLLFDPRVSAKSENGAAVLNGSQDVTGKISPVKNKRHLAAENLDDFLVFHEDLQEQPAGDQCEGQAGTEAADSWGQTTGLSDSRVQISI